MIPKVIHYCWFGGKPLPKSALRCISSWRKFLPDYEIKEWNEGNFDVNMIPYTAEAYAAKKYAFVSDFARFWVLHEHGGVYFDTDVEVIASMDDILEKGAFMGVEAMTHPEQKEIFVAAGLGCACEKGNVMWRKIIERYSSFNHFDLNAQGTVCTIVSDLIEKEGIELRDALISAANLTIYPSDYFCPQAMMGAPIHLTNNTRSIHHYDATWLPWSVRIRRKVMSILPAFLQKALRKLLHHS